MIQITFLSADGTTRTKVDANEGACLLDVAQACDQPLEGTCEGQMACSTCHVVVDPADFEKLPRASAMEEDLLDLAAHVRRTSRLACQIRLTEEMGSLTLHMPAAARNMQGR